MLVLVSTVTPVSADVLLSDHFNGATGELTGWKARTGQSWEAQTAKWNSGSLVAGREFGQRRTAGVGYRDDAGVRWHGNVLGLGRELRSGTVVFGVDIRQGIGVQESCAALTSGDGVEDVTLIWTGQRLKCGGNTWAGEIDMGIAEGNVRVELILRLDADAPGNSTAAMRYLDIDNPENRGSVDLGRPRNPDRNGSGSFEFSRVALHVLKGGDARSGFDNVSVRDNLEDVPALNTVPVATKRLMLDSRLIADVENAALRVGTVRKHPANPLFGEEHEWESRFDNLYPNVIYDEDEKLYKVWYFTWTYDPATSDVPRDQRKPGTYMKVREASGKGLKEGLGYATSKDGIQWDKPLMRVSPWKGQPSNLVAQPCHGAGIFKDLRERDPARRYKMFHKGQGMSARFSPDGICWGQYVPLPEIDAAGDTHNNALWCPELKKYVGFTRLWRDGMRVVGRTESRDFVYWTRAVEVLGDRRDMQPYSMPVIRYAGVYLGLPAILRKKDDRAHTELAWSPDTVHWHRIEPGTPLIPNSTKRGDYDWGTVYASFPIIRDHEIRIYYGGCNGQHFDWRDGFLCLATLRPDGFAGYRPVAVDRPAAVTTQPIKVAGELRVSADVNKGGALTVSMLDEQNKVIAQSKPITSNVSNHRVDWSNGATMEGYVGRDVRLRFTFSKGTVYAFEL